MNVQILRNELQDVLSGRSSVRFGGTLQSIARYLGNGQGTSRKFEDQKRFKKQEEESLIHFIADNKLLLNNIDFSQYVSVIIEDLHGPLQEVPVIHILEPAQALHTLLANQFGIFKYNTYLYKIYT